MTLASAGETGEAALRRRLAAMWAELLDRRTVGTDDNFFDIGGHSLLLVQLQTLLKESFGASVPISELFAHPTVRSLARQLASRRDRRGRRNRGGAHGCANRDNAN